MPTIPENIIETASKALFQFAWRLPSHTTMLFMLVNLCTSVTSTLKGKSVSEYLWGIVDALAFIKCHPQVINLVSLNTLFPVLEPHYKLQESLKISTQLPTVLEIETMPFWIWVERFINWDTDPWTALSIPGQIIFSWSELTHRVISNQKARKSLKKKNDFALM